MHPHGVLYEKDSEGADYNDNTTGKNKEDGCVAPGVTHTYAWQIPERAGPGPADPSSLFWLYHSHCDELRDVASGLFGGFEVTRRGEATPDGRPRDVDHEFVTMFIAPTRTRAGIWMTISATVASIRRRSKRVNSARSRLPESAHPPRTRVSFPPTPNGQSTDTSMATHR